MRLLKSNGIISWRFYGGTFILNKAVQKILKFTVYSYILTCNELKKRTKKNLT